MVTLTIDNKQVSVPAGTTILDAARAVDIHIPTLCYLREINEVASCRVCAVEVEGVDKLATACNTLVEEGMVVHTNTQRVRLTRKTNVELILSQHVDHCVTCVRSGNCSLQALSKAMNIQSPSEKRPLNAPGTLPFPFCGTVPNASNVFGASRSVTGSSPWAFGRSPAPAPIPRCASGAGCG